MNFETHGEPQIVMLQHREQWKKQMVKLKEFLSSSVGVIIDHYFTKGKT